MKLEFLCQFQGREDPPHFCHQRIRHSKIPTKATHLSSRIISKDTTTGSFLVLSPHKQNHQHSSSPTDVEGTLNQSNIPHISLWALTELARSPPVLYAEVVSTAKLFLGQTRFPQTQAYS